MGFSAESSSKECENTRMAKIVSALLVGALLLGLCDPTWAQQPAKDSRIGFLSSQSQKRHAEATEAFRQGLRELGYIEGKGFAVEYRWYWKIWKRLTARSPK